MSYLRGKIAPIYNGISGVVGARFVRPHLISQKSAFEKISEAIENQVPFAMGKIGFGESELLPALERIKKNLGSTNIQASPLHATKLQRVIARRNYNMGLFPPTIDETVAWGERYGQAILSFDILGLPAINYRSYKLIHIYQLSGKCILGDETEPHGYSPRPQPDYPSFMEALTGKRVLIINPLADLFASRSTENVHKACWGEKVPWWNPKEVQSFPIPSAHFQGTMDQYGTSQSLIRQLRKDLAQFDYDVALIGAGCYGFELAEQCKKDGKVGIVLGGMLQLIFGVYGNRWIERTTWKHLWNDSFIRPPREAVPERATLLEGACYW